MKKLFVLFSCTLLLSSPLVSAQDVDVEKVNAEIAEIEKQIEELNAKKAELQQKLPKNEIQAQVLQTNNGTYTFTKLFIHKPSGMALIPFTYQNNSTEAKSLWTELAFDLNFEQEDENSVYKSEIKMYDAPQIINDMKRLELDTKIKAGGAINTYSAFTMPLPDSDLYIRTTTLGSSQPQEVILKISDAEYFE